MRINDLKNKKIAIWGVGTEGTAVLRVLQNKFPQSTITILNDSPLTPDDISNLKSIKPDLSILTGDNIESSLMAFEVIIKSPGISSYRPEIVEAQKRGVWFTSSTQLWFHEHRDEKIIAVTGTKGKSTTTSLIAHMLESLGYRVTLAGNIGMPLIEMIDIDPKPDFWVLEMSSYQTSDFQGSVSVAVLLNLYPEHLDWHGSVENYYHDKLNLLRQVKDGVVVLDRHCTLPERDVDLRPRQVIYFNHANGLHIQDGAIYDGNQALIKTSGLPLRGKHNLSNICAVLTVLKSLNIDLKKAIQALSDFSALPHRLTILGEKNGVLYVDDSISTIPQSAIAAMEAFRDRPITILLGGFDRGVDMGVLVDYLIQHPVYAVITMPDSGYRIAKTIRDRSKNFSFQLYEAEHLQDAVKIAQQITPIGGVVLLSPASPSFGAFKNYKERGERFADVTFGV